MLFEKKYSEGDVISLKLLSGEEVIGRYVSEDMTTLTLSKPLMIAMTSKGPGMAPIMITVTPESDLSFSKQSVMITAKCYKEIADQYIYQTTGIQPVSAGTILK